MGRLHQAMDESREVCILVAALAATLGALFGLSPMLFYG